MNDLLNMWKIYTFLSFPVVKVGDNIERELFQTFPCWALKFSFMAPLKPRRTYKIGRGHTYSQPGSKNRENMYITVRTTKTLITETLVPRYIFFLLIFECNSTRLVSNWKVLELEPLTRSGSGTVIECILFAFISLYRTLTLFSLPLCLWNC